MKLYQLFTFLLLRLYEKTAVFDYPPVNRDESHVEVYHGVKVPDPYHWLEDLESPETKAFVKAQNQLTDNYLKKCPSRSKIQEGLEELMKYTRYDVPTVTGTRYFSTEAVGLQSQNVLNVQESLYGEKRLLVDPNTLASDGTTSIRTYRPSKDGQLLAYGLRANGSDWFTIHFLNVNTGVSLNDSFAKTKFSPMEWTVDSKGIFYSRYPDLENMTEGVVTAANSNAKIYYHVVGTPQSQDVLVVEFPEHQNWSSFPTVSHDGKYLIVFVEVDIATNRVYYVELDKWINDGRPPLPTIYAVVDNFQAKYQYVTNMENVFIFRTNRKASNHRLVGINIYNPGEANWDNNFVPEDPSKVMYNALAVNSDQIILMYKEKVRDIVQLRDLNDGSVLWTWTPELGVIWDLRGHRDSSEFFFKFESIVSPGTIYRIDLSDRNFTLGPRLERYRKLEIASLRPADYLTKQVFYPSKDGTIVPMFIAHKKGIEPGPETPAILYGYGGFETMSEPYFDVQGSFLMKNFNGVFAIANIRGGNEYGKVWHDGGRLLKKQNVFDDFQAAAEYLIAENYTSSPKLTITGTSNGGLLVAACINQRPDLFGAAIVRVGVTDMLKYHKNTGGASWIGEYGNSDDETTFHYLMTYSPLHNVRMPSDNRTQYPATLVITGDHDDRVVPSHSFKLIAELQHTVGRSEHQTNPLLLRTNENVGHGAGMPTWKVVEDETNAFSFLCKALNLKFIPDPEPSDEDYYD